MDMVGEQRRDEADIVAISHADNSLEREAENDAEAHVTAVRRRLDNDEEEVCGVCLEVPARGCFVELWCCGNVLCVNDAQLLGRCPFCREEPLVWNITK